MRRPFPPVMQRRKSRSDGGSAPEAGIQALFGHGLRLHQQGLLPAAKTTYEQVLAGDPRHFDALHLLGVLNYQLGDPEAAARWFDRAVLVSPNHAGALSNYGLALQDLGRYVEALASFDRAISLAPHLPEAHFNKGSCLHAQGLFEKALGSYDRALELNPAYAKAFGARGSALQLLGRLQEALTSFDQALSLSPVSAGVLLNRGNVLQILGRVDEAIASFEQAISIDPRLADAHYNKGNSLKALKRMPEALAAYDQAISLRPGYAEALWNKSLALLLMGQLRAAWPLYEWRWSVGNSGNAPETFSRPTWLGSEDIRDRTLLIHAEQGLGDTLQFCRYVKCVKDAGARVILEVQRPLIGVLKGLNGVDELIEQGAPRPDFDFHCPLLSLPLAFKTDLDTIPSRGPYIRSSQDRLSHWAQRLGDRRGLRVGLVWSGSSSHKRDAERSLNLKDLLSFLPEGPEYVSLQKEVRPEDVHALASGTIRHFGGDLQSFADTAALCDLMDLVVTVDTSVAHLAGAMGKPTWVLLAQIPDWRWLLDRSDSPWYQSVSLYRQADRGNWSPVLAQLAADLGAMVGSGPLLKAYN